MRWYLWKWLQATCNFLKYHSLPKDITKKRIWEHIKSYHVLALKQDLLPSKDVLGRKDPHNTEELTLPWEYEAGVSAKVCYSTQPCVVPTQIPVCHARSCSQKAVCSTFAPQNQQIALAEQSCHIGWHLLHPLFYLSLDVYLQNQILL